MSTAAYDKWNQDAWENTPQRGKALTWYYYDKNMARVLMMSLGQEIKRLDKLRASANNSTAPNPSPPHASISAKKEKGLGALLQKPHRILKDNDPTRNSGIDTTTPKSYISQTAPRRSTTPRKQNDF